MMVTALVPGVATVRVNRAAAPRQRHPCFTLTS